MSFHCCGLIPVYNHPDAISDVVDGVLAAGLPVILVDDGSGQACRDVLVMLAAGDPRIHVRHLPHNLGKGGAVKAGLRMAQALGYSHALQIDADGQHDAREIPRLLDFGRRHPRAIISGRPNYDGSVPTLRYYCRYLTHAWVWINTLSLKIEDSMCGFRVYPVVSCCQLLERQFTGNRMDFDIEVLVRWQWNGGDILQLPVKVCYPADGISHFRGWEDNWLITRMHIRLFFGMLARLPGLLIRRLRPSSSEKREGAFVKPPHWAAIGETGALWGLRFMFRVYRWLGRMPFRVCLYPVILYYFVVHRGARQASQQYLCHLEQQGLLPGGRSLTALSYRHFLNFGESMLDKLAVWQGGITLDDIRFVGHEAFDELADSGRGGLLIGSHLGNLEICRALAQRNTGMTFNVLMHTAHASRFNEMLRQVSGYSHVNILQVSDISPATAIVLQQKLDAGEFLVIAGDRTPVSGEGNTSEAQFLGEAARFPIGPFILASVLRCPVLSIFCLRQEQGGKPAYDLYMEPFAECIQLPRKDRHSALEAYVQRWAGCLEHYCAREPLQWYNFYDFWARPGR